MRTNWIYF